MTNRQQQYLKLIIESYIENGVPVASSYLIKKHNLPVSSATVRHEMNSLEMQGFLEKSHTSSGRIPSIIGYEYYAKKLADKKSDDLKNKLKDIFAKRRVSIDLTLDEAASTIFDLTELTLVTSSSENDELLKSIQLTPINDDAATIVLVTSTGRVESKFIEMGKSVKIGDVRIAVRLFKERLLETPLKDIARKLEVLAPILEESIKNYEAVLKAFVKRVFDFHNKVKNRVYGNDGLILQKEIKREDLAKLIDLIENKSIWSSIEGNLDEDETLKIEIRPNNTSIVSKKIPYGDSSKEISIVGSNRMDYAEAKNVIKILEQFLGGK